MTIYVLVYERCPEDENKDEESKERAEVLEIMREEFEKSLSKAGLILQYHKIPDKRRLVSTKLPLKESCNILEATF